jgi:cytochrome c1
MPAGYDKILSPQELADLVAYLESCGKKALTQPSR